MKTSLNKFLIIVFVLFVTSSCSKEEDTLIVIEPTAQEMILGTWRIDSIVTDINVFAFQQEEATVTFQQDSIMIFQNNGFQTFIPTGESQRVYFIDKFCGPSADTSCTDEEKIDILVTFVTTRIYNSLHFENNGNKLIFGRNYVDGGDYYCTKIHDNL